MVTFQQAPCIESSKDQTNIRYTLGISYGSGSSKRYQKFKTFLWSVPLNKILTKEQLKQRKILPEDMCNRCNTHPKTTIHLMRDCQHSHQFWQQTFRLLRFQPQNFFIEPDIFTLVKLNSTNHTTVSYNTTEITMEYPLFLLSWFLWNNRNQLMYNANHTQTLQPYFYLARAVEYLVANDLTQLTTTHRTITKNIRWIPPNPPHLKLNVDGSARGNPRIGGIGGVFRNAHGEWILGFKKTLIWTTNLAEITTLWQGLQIAVEKGYQQIEIEMDSLTAIQLIFTNDDDNYENVILDCRLLLASQATVVAVETYF